MAQRFNYQFAKTDTLASTMAAGATSATLSSGNFANFTGDYLVLDYDVPSKREIIKCNVTGTAIASATRAVDGTSDVEHTAGAKVGYMWLPVHADHVSTAAEDGWVQSADTWVYASASTFTISGVDRTSIYQAGTKLRFKQGGSYKYAYVASSSFSTNTTVTIDVNTDYTIANSAITDNYFSYIENPQGFPYEFNWNPSFTNWTIGTGGSAGTTARYRRVGKYVNAEITTTLGSSGQSVGTNVTFAAPVSARTNFLGTDSMAICGLVQFQDSATASYFGIVRFSGNVSTLQILVNNCASTYGVADALASTVPITWAAGDCMTIQFSYPAA